MNRAVAPLLAVLAMAGLAPTSAVAAVPVEVRAGEASEVVQVEGRSPVHRASGIIYPEKAGALRLGKLSVFGPGDVVGVYYLSGEPGDTLLSFFVYPASQGMDAEERSVTAAIDRAWRAERLAPPVALRLPAGARVGWYDLENKHSTGRSVYVIVRRGDWYLKARMTLAAATSGDAGLALVQSAMDALPWAE